MIRIALRYLCVVVVLVASCKIPSATQEDGAPPSVPKAQPDGAAAPGLSWQEGLKHPDPQVRAEACRSILPSETKVLPPELLRALGDKSAIVRVAAVKGVLGYILRYADSSALPKLLELAASDSDRAVRAEAVRTLGALNHRDVVPGLVKIYPKEKDSRIRDEILAIFAREGDRRAGAVLIPALKEEWPPPLVFEALRRVADPRTVPALLKLLEHGSGAIRSNAVQVLGDIGDARAAAPLVKALLDSNVGVVREAISAVGQMGSPLGIAPLLKLAKHKEEAIRLRAVRSLATYRNPDVLPGKEIFSRLKTGFDKEPLDIRIEAVRLFGASGARQAIPLLRKASARNQPPALRVAALEAMGKLGDPATIPTLTAALRDDAAAVRSEAAGALAHLGHLAKGAAEALRKAYSAPERDIDARVAIVRALGKLGDASSATLLKEAGEKDAVPIVRVEAGGALLGLGRVEGIAVLRPILVGSSDWQERRGAAQAIDPSSKVAGVTALIVQALATEREPMVREELYRKLGQATGKVAALHQRHVLREKVPIFRLMAADGLCKNGDPAGCKILIRSLNDPDAAVRAEAARRIGRLRVSAAAADLRRTTEDPVLWVANAARDALARIGK